MRQVIWLGIVGAACMVAAATTACGGGSSGTGGTGGTGATTGPSSSSASAGTGGTGGSASNLVNGCDPAKAEDHTADAMVTIAFPMGVNLVYTPACIKVKAGTKLVFNGDFVSHPLNGGVNNMTDATSPITVTSTGTTATFTLDKAGTFGWFCGIHGAFGMEGAAFVQ